MLVLVDSQISKSKNINCAVNACGLECERLVCGINKKEMYL